MLVPATSAGPEKMHMFFSIIFIFFIESPEHLTLGYFYFKDLSSSFWY
jgi:hypothetical protein